LWGGIVSRWPIFNRPLERSTYFTEGRLKIGQQDAILSQWACGPQKCDENPPPDARRIFNGLQWVFDRAPPSPNLEFRTFYVDLY